MGVLDIYAVNGLFFLDFQFQLLQDKTEARRMVLEVVYGIAPRAVLISGL